MVGAADKKTRKALQDAAAENLELEPSVTEGGASGFKGVYVHGRSKRFVAQIADGSGGHTNLGSFDTAEEAALAYARVREGEA